MRTIQDQGRPTPEADRAAPEADPVPAERTAKPSLPLSVRIVATYALLVAATLLIVASLVIHFSRDYLASEIDHDIEATLRSFEQGPAMEVTGRDDLVSEAREWLALQPISRDQVVAVRAFGRKRILQSHSDVDIRSIENSTALLSATEARWWDVEAETGSMRALTVPLRAEEGGRQLGTMVIAASRAPLESTLSALLLRIGWASAVGLLFAALLGLAAIRRTLRPLAQMSRDIDTIQESGDLSKRVAHEGPSDEVGRLALAFDRMLGRLEGVFQGQRRFLSDASHELRTPLTVARGQLELLQEEIETARGRRSMSLAVEELDRMRRIVEDLLLLARLDEGLQLERQPVEVELVLREALLRGMMLGRRNARVEAEQGLYAWADPERLHQVLTNLVTNAVKHAGEDATIMLRAGRAGDRVRMEVADSGPGIPEEELAHVFERLYRGSNARAGSGAGAGLGLAIAASLVQAMGGIIDVSSVQDGGTTFRVSLPVAEAPHHHDDGSDGTTELPQAPIGS